MIMFPRRYSVKNSCLIPIKILNFNKCEGAREVKGHKKKARRQTNLFTNQKPKTIKCKSNKLCGLALECSLENYFSHDSKIRIVNS
jgi:hypothetical protein